MKLVRNKKPKKPKPDECRWWRHRRNSPNLLVTYYLDQWVQVGTTHPIQTDKWNYWSDRPVARPTDLVD